MSKASSRAINDAIAERQRQQQVEGFTLKHDDDHDQGELAALAICYTLASLGTDRDAIYAHFPQKPLSAVTKWANFEPGHRRRNLVKATALLLAEIERLDRTPESVSTCQSRIDGISA